MVLDSKKYRIFLTLQKILLASTGIENGVGKSIEVNTWEKRIWAIRVQIRDSTKTYMLLSS